MYACFYDIKRKKSELSCVLLPHLRRLLHFDLQCTKLVLHCLRLLLQQKLLLCQPYFKLLLHFLLGVLHLQLKITHQSNILSIKRETRCILIHSKRGRWLRNRQKLRFALGVAAKSTIQENNVLQSGLDAGGDKLVNALLN